MKPLAVRDYKNNMRLNRGEATKVVTNYEQVGLGTTMSRSL